MRQVIPHTNFDRTFNGTCIYRVATFLENLENLEKSGNFKIALISPGKPGKPENEDKILENSGNFNLE